MTTKHKWQQVTIVGCGLIGSSFALALRRSGACERIAGWDTSTSELNEALALGVIDEVDHGLAAGEISVSDLIYLAIPVLQIVEFLRERLLQIKPGAIVTDAGSTKASICRAATDYLPESCHFIGGHPIAGSHLSGVGQARGDLFDGEQMHAKDRIEGALVATKGTSVVVELLVGFAGLNEKIGMVRF